MRIAVNASILSEWVGGLATYSHSLIDYLCQSGHEVVVYTPGCVKLNGHPPALRRSTPGAIRGAAGSIGSLLRATVWCQTVLPALVLRDRVDVLLSVTTEGMLIPTCPQVLVVHDLLPLFFPEEYRRWKYYFRYVLPRLLKSSARVVAISEHTKQDLVREFGVLEDEIEVVYNGVDPVFFSPDAGSHPKGYEAGPYFLFIGASIPRKNLETVIRALALVRDEIPHRLVCVLGLNYESKRQYCSRMMRLAAELGIGQRLNIYSHLARREILFLYRHATALVMLSQYEGFGYPPLEAMAVGTPAIVSDSTSLAEVSGAAAVCVPCMDVEVAAEAMLQMATEPDYRQRLSEAGVSHAAKFTREETGRHILSVLQSSSEKS